MEERETEDGGNVRSFKKGSRLKRWWKKKRSRTESEPQRVRQTDDDSGFLRMSRLFSKFKKDRPESAQISRRKKNAKVTEESHLDAGAAVSEEEDEELAVVGAAAKAEGGAEGVWTEDEEEEGDDSQLREKKEGTATQISHHNQIKLEDLYSEALYEVLHMIGDGGEEEREELYAYLREAFKFDEEKHSSLLEGAKLKEAPDIVLKIEVVEAKQLKSKKANGLSDPYCTLYLTSSEEHRYNTSVKSETLCPSWEEHFSLPLKKCLEDHLNVEIWDSYPAEPVTEKIRKVREVRGAKGCWRFMTEIRNQNDKLIGSHAIQIKSIPVKGLELWCPLEKKRKTKIRGMVKLKLAVGSAKTSQVGMQEHRSLIKVLLPYELESEKCGPYNWKGEFSPKGEKLLAQHLALVGIGESRQFLAHWIEYINVHVDKPLHFVAFSHLLETLVPSLQSGTTFSEDEVQLFWDSYKKLLPSCYNCIRKVRRLSKDDKASQLQLTALLSIFANLKSLKFPEGFELFSPSWFSWFKTIENGCDIEGSLRDAVTQSAQKRINVILNKNKTDETSDEAKLKHVIKVTQMLQDDLKQALEFHEKYFQGILHFPYTKTLCKVYDYELSEIAKPIVNDVCLKLKPSEFSDGPKDALNDTECLKMGTSLFLLYHDLHKFLNLAKEIDSLNLSELKMQDLHNWFTKGVDYWLDKEMQMIEKAVELDTLVPIDSCVRYSCSVVDTLAIYYEVQILWDKLSLPDYGLNHINNICRCSVQYSDKLFERVNGMGGENSSEEKFKVTNEWCVAINNLDYIQESLAKFFQELSTDTVLKKLADNQSEHEAENKMEQLKLLVSYAGETIKEKKVNLIQMLTNKMSPAIQCFLQEQAELLKQETNTMDPLMKYLDDNVNTLHSKLSTENFDQAMENIWEHVEAKLLTMVETGVEKCHPPSFFSNLHETLRTLLSFFQREEQCCQMQQQQEDLVTEDSCEEEHGKQNKMKGRNASKRNIERIQSLLSLYGMETYKLIHQYHLERYGEQLHIEENGRRSSLSLITVRLQFEEDQLQIEILNARKLKPMDENGSLNPYVRVHFLPEEYFKGVNKPRTKTHKDTLNPTFEKVFKVRMSSDQIQRKDAMVQFVMKNIYMICCKELIAEAYIPFSKIPSTCKTTDLADLPQNHLPLTRPTNPDSKFLLVMKDRHHDKIAQNFYKRKKTINANENCVCELMCCCTRKN